MEGDCEEKNTKSMEEERGNSAASSLSVLSWNVDGLDAEEQPERARGLCSYLTSLSPDVVFLQEMIQPYMRFLHKRLAAEYTLIQGGDEGYFTVMLLKKSRVSLRKHQIVDFPNSRMMRNLLLAQVTFGGQKLCLMTSHFESCKENAAERMRQLRLVMKTMDEAPDDITVLFGGDTNLRDAEVSRVGLPGSVCDVWQQLGEPESCRYTWDTELNSNKDVHFKCRLRFDRLYLRRTTRDGLPRLEPDGMSLVGLEKLRCGRFTSDHWGVHCSFSGL